jgi:hypothetical protein
MKDIIYFRGRRVASTAVSNWLENNQHVDMWTNKNHYLLPVTKQQCIEEMGEEYWNKTLKTICVRNVFVNSVSIFLHHKIHCKPAGQIPDDILEKLIKQYREEVADTWKNRNDPKYIAKNGLVWHFDRQKDIYTDNQPVVDFYINYEQLDESIDNFYVQVLNDPQLELRKEDTAADHVIDIWRKTKNKYNPGMFFDSETYEMVQSMRQEEVDQFNWELSI